jgi:putative membrane protein
MENFTMLKRKNIFQLAGAAAVTVLLCASPIHAQNAGSSGSTAQAGSSGTTAISDDDRKLMEDVAHANLAEIETGKIAVAKAQDPQVKQFAQKMIDDHTTALNELQQLAQTKGVNLPTDTDTLHKTMATALEKLNGETFDKQYISRIGVGDHERTETLLKKVAGKAKDPDLKAYAQKTLMAVDQHLQMGRKMRDPK